MDNIQIDGKEFKIFISETQIQKRVSEMAQKVEKKYKGKNPLFIVILNGAFVFASDFFKTYSSSCEIEFVKLISYVEKESSGEVINCIGITEEMVKNRQVIILEDIIESGLTMEYFIDYLNHFHPKSVEVISLLFKPDCLRKDINLNCFGFSIDSGFVVGYGLDYNHKGRNLNNIYQIVNS
ncbi:MAG: hypoxanthine phosphoribosyltransferase [Chitinophagales bacterium]|nr:hypoxanthine phosphoribosyltransferase [Chitinophagales bacterium]MCZ2394579.1 hypoxanthine phosphoribosyltransferase [Chitinophagales bacterium]